MSTKIELLDLLAKLKNCIAVYEMDRDNSEFEDEPEVIANFKKAIPVLEKTFPMLAAIEDLLYGDTTPVIFNKTWSQVFALTQLETVINSPESIGTEVTSFLKKVSTTKDPRKKRGGKGDTV